jgi:hypothetical protein
MSEQPGTEQWYFDIIKPTSFRAKIICGHYKITIKVHSIFAIYYLSKFFKNNGIVGIEYKFERLGLFECWFPRYQIKRIK